MTYPVATVLCGLASRSCKFLWEAWKWRGQVLKASSLTSPESAVVTTEHSPNIS